MASTTQPILGSIKHTARSNSRHEQVMPIMASTMLDETVISDTVASDFIGMTNSKSETCRLDLAHSYRSARTEASLASALNCISVETCRKPNQLVMCLICMLTMAVAMLHSMCTFIETSPQHRDPFWASVWSKAGPLSSPG